MPTTHYAQPGHDFEPRVHTLSLGYQAQSGRAGLKVGRVGWVVFGRVGWLVLGRGGWFVRGVVGSSACLPAEAGLYPIDCGGDGFEGGGHDVRIRSHTPGDDTVLTRAHLTLHIRCGKCVTAG
jgi:hypothetical protein